MRTGDKQSDGKTSCEEGVLSLSSQGKWREVLETPHKNLPPFFFVPFSFFLRGIKKGKKKKQKKRREWRR